MAYDVGNTANLDLTVTPFDVTTDAAVQVTSPTGIVSNPTATTADGGNHWVAQVLLNEPGTWVAYWTTTGLGVGAKSITVEVDTLPPMTEAQSDVRLLISDTDPANRFFSTREISRFLAMNADHTRRAAAQALDVWAANEAMVSKKITTQDLSTDGPAVAAALRAAATELRRQADSGEDGSDDVGFEIVEYQPYPCRPGWPY